MAVGAVFLVDGFENKKKTSQCNPRSKAENIKLSVKNKKLGYSLDRGYPLIFIFQNIRMGHAFLVMHSKNNRRDSKKNLLCFHPNN